MNAKRLSENDYCSFTLELLLDILSELRVSFGEGTVFP